VTPGSPGTAGRDYRTPEQPHPWTPVAADVGQRVMCTCGRERDQHGGRNGLSADLRPADALADLRVPLGTIPEPRRATQGEVEREAAS
jgi:hypothetical protein